MSKTQQEIIGQGYQALVKSLGVVDAIRFIQYFSKGQGDYTQERHQWLEQISLENMLERMTNAETNDFNQYDEIID